MAKWKAETKIDESSNCPNCGEQRLVRIAYGYPSASTMELSERGLIMLGGCILMRDNPQLHCSACGQSVRADGRTREQASRPTP